MWSIVLHGQTGWASTRRRSFPSQSPGPCSCGQPQLSGLRDFLSPHLFMRPSSGLLSMCLLLPAACVYPPAVPNSPPPPPPTTTTNAHACVQCTQAPCIALLSNIDSSDLTLVSCASAWQIVFPQMPQGRRNSAAMYPRCVAARKAH